MNQLLDDRGFAMAQAPCASSEHPEGGKMKRTVVVITDCHCANAVMRQSMAWQKSVGSAPSTIVPITGDIDGAGVLVDALVEARDEPWVIVCQTSPRNDSAANKDNGSPFGFFWHRNTLVIASVAGRMLSLAKELKFLYNVRLMDVPAVMSYMIYDHRLCQREDVKSYSIIARSQFRSLKFVPRVAGWILEHVKFPTTELPIFNIPNFGMRVWWVDNFGNCKTSLRNNNIYWYEGCVLRTTLGNFQCVRHLQAVPKGKAAAVVGSSGIESEEFIEFVVQGGSAAKRYGLKVGSEFKLLPSRTILRKGGM